MKTREPLYYIVLKELPGIPVGSKMYKKEGDYYCTNPLLNSKSTFEIWECYLYPCWFKPVYKKRRWRPAYGETYYGISSYGSICQGPWLSDTVDEDYYRFGTVFKTRELAEKARDKVRKVLLSCKHS